MTTLLLGAAAATAFLLALAVGLNVALLPRPRRFGFDVREGEE